MHNERVGRREFVNETTDYEAKLCSEKKNSLDKENKITAEELSAPVIFSKAVLVSGLSKNPKPDESPIHLDNTVVDLNLNRDFSGSTEKKLVMKSKDSST